MREWGARLTLRGRLVVAALRRSGARAALAIVAVAAGVAATLVSLALAAGAERELEETASRVGRDLLMVTSARVLAPPSRGGGWYVSRRLDRGDVDRLRGEVVGLAAVAPVLESSRRVELGRESVVTTVRGVTPEYVALRRFAVERGRALDARDEGEARRVAVVGPFVAERLRAGEGIVGRTLVVGGVPFEVVGRLAAKGMSDDGQNEDDQVLVPLETARRRVFGVEWLSRLVAQATSAEAMAGVAAGARAVLRDAHHLTTELPDDFQIQPLVRTSEIRRMSNAFLRGMTTIFAAATLGVGGVGVLAVSFLNVRDRRAEIGLRRAVGARRRDIAALFVAESLALGAAGGVAGLGLGALAVGILGRSLHWRMAIAPGSVVEPLAVSLALGLVFGLAPAIAGARTTPIAALRDG